MRRTKAIWNRVVSVFITFLLIVSLTIVFPVGNNVDAAATLLYPLPEGSFVLSQKYSSSHKAVDWSTKKQTGIPIYAVEDGVVRSAAVCGTYGVLVVLWHESLGRYTAYAHCENTNYVTVGQEVKRGDVIATVGMTGTTSGPHLHFMIFKQMQSSSSNYPAEATCEDPLSYSYSYDVDRTPHLTISNYDPLPSGKLTQGQSFPVKGVISGYPNINHVWGGVYTRDGNATAQYLDKYVNTSSYNLATYFDPYIIFNDLPVGYYTYKIEATTTDGQYKCIQSDFQIGDPPPSTYTITLNANGGSVSPTSIIVSANGTYSGLPNPSKTGYTFAGWYTALTGGTKKENGSSLASNSNHTLYAHWTANTYKVSFNANGGSGSMSDQMLTYDQAANLTANAFKKTGYSFAGWNTKSDGSGTSYADKVSVKNLATSGSVTLYAQWSAGGYTIVYNANGGSGSMDSKEMKYDQTANLTANAFTAPKGYSFSSWNTKADGSGTSYADKASVKNLAASGTVTLYAIWSPNKYTVKFDGNGADELSSTSKEVTYNSTYGDLPQPTRSGYNFIGWYTKAEGGNAITPDAKVTITGTQTLYAQWSQVKFLITFNATGGISESAQKLVTYDKAYGVLPTAERTGYTFKGWYLDEACTKQITSDTIVSLTANQSVYAKWELRRYVITFDATGGVAERDSKQVTYGKAYGVLPSATKDGDEFIGWFTEDGIEITSASIVEIEYDTTLYAKWASDEVIGDVNSDGVFNVADVVMMQKWLLCAGDLTDWQAGDLCRDERIDVFDLCLMKRLLIEKEGN